MSIAQEEKQINEIIVSSKQRLRVVDEKIQELNNEKLSIDEDISILTQRLDIIRDRLSRKKDAYQSVSSLTAESEDAYRKIKQSTRMLLAGMKKQFKKVEEMLQGDSKDEDND